MTDRSCSALALIVDHDLGFLMWLGELFAELGCPAVPALHCRQAMALSKRLQAPVTILIVNPELRGARRMVELMTAANPALRLILIRDEAKKQNAGELGGVRAQTTLDRPLPWETISHPEWITRVRKLLFLAAGT